MNVDLDLTGLTKLGLFESAKEIAMLWKGKMCAVKDKQEMRKSL